MVGDGAGLASAPVGDDVWTKPSCHVECEDSVKHDEPEVCRVYGAKRGVVERLKKRSSLFRRNMTLWSIITLTYSVFSISDVMLMSVPLPPDSSRWH